MTRVLLPRWRDGHAFNAVLFNRARNEAGSFHIFDELAQIFYRLAAAFDDSDRLADRHRALAVRIVSPLGVTANADTNVSNTNTACSSLYEYAVALAVDSKFRFAFDCHFNRFRDFLIEHFVSREKHNIV